MSSPAAKSDLKRGFALGSSSRYFSITTGMGLRELLAYRAGCVVRKLIRYTTLCHLSKRVSLPPDCFNTPHSTSWFDDWIFQQCYGSAIQVTGEDYRIPWRVHQLLWCLSATKEIEGDILELGSAKGFMMAAAARWCDIKEDRRSIELYDLFVKHEMSGAGDVRHDHYYAESPSSVRRSFSSFPRTSLVVGDVRHTLAARPGTAISLLHVDLNDPALEIEMIDLLWSHLSVGAIILLDDFANRGCESAFIQHTAYFRARELEILTTPSGQGLVQVATRPLTSGTP